MTDGVVLDPSAFSITLGVWPSIMATHELVVPKSIPITGPLTPSDLNLLCNSQKEREFCCKEIFRINLVSYKQTRLRLHLLSHKTVKDELITWLLATFFC